LDCVVYGAARASGCVQPLRFKRRVDRVNAANRVPWRGTDTL
ncbi:MAG: hypothetical protein JWP52_2280, partial [Rhizobacter sp.]|nr:hypothetical protein [Rhizobacter sp.]